MGTALDRARAMDIPVEVLVSGQWVRGLVVTADSHGVVLAAEGGEHAVVRLDAIQAVRVHAPVPGRTPIPAQRNY
jgi:hypothetical protein